MHTSREWQAVEYNILSKMHAAGKTDAEVGAILSRDDRDIRRARGRLGLESRAAGKPWSEADIALLSKLWNDGLSDVEIGKRLDRNPRTLHAKREALGMINKRYTPPVDRAMTAAECLALSPLSPDEKNFKRRAAATTGLLISLKRAGHTYGQGEFSIPSEARVVRPSDLVGA